MKFIYSVLKSLFHFLKIHILNAYGIVPFEDYDKRHLSRQIVLLITLSPIAYLIGLILVELTRIKIL